MNTVLKPFNTHLRRFAIGDKVPADADLSPHAIGELRQRHFVGDHPPGEVAKATKPKK